MADQAKKGNSTTGSPRRWPRGVRSLAVITQPCRVCDGFHPSDAGDAQGQGSEPRCDVTTPRQASFGRAGGKRAAFEKQHGPIQDHGRRPWHAFALHGLGVRPEPTSAWCRGRRRGLRTSTSGLAACWQLVGTGVVRGFWRMPRQIDWASGRDGRLDESQDLARS